MIRFLLWRRAVRPAACAVLAAVGCAAVAGCNIQPITQTLQILLRPPQVIASAGANQVTAVNEEVILNGSSSGVLMGDNQTFLRPGQVDLTFEWEVIQAIDRATGQPIEPLPAHTLSNPNATQARFQSGIPADWNIRLTCRLGTLAGAGITGVRVLTP